MIKTGVFTDKGLSVLVEERDDFFSEEVMLNFSEDGNVEVFVWAGHPDDPSKTFFDPNSIQEGAMRDISFAVWAALHNKTDIKEELRKALFG